MYNAPDSRAETLYKAVRDMILRLGLDFHNLRGHCFDGAANMAGRLTDVQKRITEAQPRSIFVHCSNDCLDLALQEVARNCGVVGDALNIVKDVSNAILESKKQEDCLFKRRTSSG
ncbi:hypothetical protein HPB48_005137 [Haemaphysalis longicornis]|uniref:DUF4371 domain-containing protein n=1 Tax=Haemaphysalis longicornis TaxID=44386 RepID=A0A9J6F7C1_HAELO|nr:hypothetical protein HPB48_005137 [Haemaphysalis longicornis]